MTLIGCDMRKMIGILFVSAAICLFVFDVPAAPERIVCLAPSYDEILIELGLQDKIVGTTTSSDYLPEVKHVERIGLYIKPNIEKIISLKPDLVLAADFAGQQLTAKQLSLLGIRVMTADESRGVDGIFAITEQIGKLAGVSIRTEDLLARMKAMVELIKRKTEGLVRPRVYVETGYDPMFTCGRGSFIHELIEIAGGKNIAGELAYHFPRVSSEFIISRDPDVIILPYMGRGFGRESVKQRKGWANISAVKTDRIYDDIGENVITIPSPRLILSGLPELLKRIHPEIQQEKW